MEIHHQDSAEEITALEWNIPLYTWMNISYPLYFYLFKVSTELGWDVNSTWTVLWYFPKTLQHRINFAGLRGRFLGSFVLLLLLFFFFFLYDQIPIVPCWDCFSSFLTPAPMVFLLVWFLKCCLSKRWKLHIRENGHRSRSLPLDVGCGGWGLQKPSSDQCPLNKFHPESPFQNVIKTSSSVLSLCCQEVLCLFSSARN